MDSTTQFSDSEFMDTLREIHQTQSQLLAAVETLSERVGTPALPTPDASSLDKSSQPKRKDEPEKAPPTSSDSVIRSDLREEGGTLQAPSTSSSNQRAALTSRIVLTTYPKQIGINPLPMDWGNFDPLKRGPVVVSRTPSTIRRRNVVFTRCYMQTQKS
ncbi:Uracil-regulated protein-like protein [Hapsidospora chrysogenum ATCC 11550]|uniref:Uracil-regulated protein-like protein n=1 Tax=Hapsidospora chrysogenum (strain ATCC 11550 / CBS 779.69 / DSM 880 / IAM 14645 / JCM 23072 / IMI 49137) TaxID=857340 RepID=A0A086TAA0_HAPC1|nr:Uracil-regulated protein-like protein [Hapsidospora chrysogenum ATCC 11550]